jgi:hypothetical protein
MLMWCTMVCGLITELWSRPHRDPETGRYDMRRWTGDAAPVRPGEPWTKLSTEEVCQRALQQSRRRTNYVLRMVPHVLGIFPYGEPSRSLNTLVFLSHAPLCSQSPAGSSLYAPTKT